MPFCQNCGEKLIKNANFCMRCGIPVVKVVNNTSNEQKMVYAGEIHKCPNCGDIIDAFEAVCESCGYEIRGETAAFSVMMLADKLEQIENQTMPIKNESVLKTLFGTDFKSDKKYKEELAEFEKKKQERKASLILNYPVPNTVGDIMEFMLLASSVIESERDPHDVVIKAWISKLEQVYKKAKISFGNSEEFMLIENIYEEYLFQKKRQKRLGMRKIYAVVVIEIFCAIMILCGGLAVKASGDPDSGYYTVVMFGIIIAMAAPAFLLSEKQK